MNPAETYFQVLAFLSCTSLVRATHEGITSCALERLMGPTRAQLPTWCHIGLSRADYCGTTNDPSHRTSMESRHVSRHNS
jgi:hypothetical protein